MSEFNIENNKLFLKLQSLEEELLGKKTYTYSNNITQQLIPIAQKILNNVPAYMPEYTLHDINHCNEVLRIISQILPPDVELNIVELIILIYATYLHDIGMVINREDAKQIKESREFSDMLLEFPMDTSEEEILTEYIRRTHVKRSIDYVNKFKNDFSTYKINFDFKGIDLSDWIRSVITSHELSVEKLKDETNYPKKKLIYEYEVNIQYLAVLLRLGDILDFDMFRTPYFLYKHINLKNEISIDEWKKHLSIEGQIINEKEIRFDAKCENAKIERKVRQLIKWIEQERKDSMNLLDTYPFKKYKLSLLNEIELNVRDDGSYVYNELELHLDYQKVLNILMGTELYDTPDVFIREILQNSTDACKCSMEKYKSEEYKRLGLSYKPKINIKYDSNINILEIEDNGVGMDFKTFTNYVISIGNSYYTSKRFQNEKLNFVPISNFGIGILSCFMVSNTIEIESLKFNNLTEPALPIHYILNVNERYIDQRKGAKTTHGTKIRLKLHDQYGEKLKESSLVKIMKENMICNDIPIYVEVDKEEVVLCSEEITIPNEYEVIDDIIIIDINNIDWLKGYIVIHKGQHQSIIEQSKIAQQGFIINSKNKNPIDINIGWLQFCRFFINILPPHTVSLKASRSSIKEDEKLLYLKYTLMKIIINYFEENKDKRILYNFLSDARGNVLSGDCEEYKFLIQNIEFTFYDVKAQQLYNASFQDFMLKCALETNIAIICTPFVDKSEFIQNELCKYDYIFFTDNLIFYFIQLAEPFTLRNELIISEIPGYIYNHMILKLDKELTPQIYSKKFSWYRTYDLLYKEKYDNVFCVVANNQYNSINIQINEKHHLGSLLKISSQSLYTKRFVGSLKTNISTAVINGVKLQNYNNYNGELFLMVNNYIPYSLNTVNFMTIDFINEINRYMHSELLLPLCSEGYIKEQEVETYMLSPNDFPNWWFQ